jgi:hypothetical protein
MSHRKTDLGIPSRYTRPNPSTRPRLGKGDASHAHRQAGRLGH